MDLFIIIRVSLRALRRNKLRSLLTILGIVIGVCAVITLVNVGNGAQISIENAISSLGTNLLIILIIFPGSITKAGMRVGYGSVSTLTVEDAQAIQDECSAIHMVSPVVSEAAQVVFQNQNWRTTVLGVNPDYQRIKNWSLESGEFFTYQDVKASTKVCILGSTFFYSCLVDKIL